MHVLGFLVLMLCDGSLGFPVPVDGIIVQVQQWGVVGAQRVVEQVILNGVSLPSTSQQVDSIIQTMSADALLPTVISVNQTSGLRNHTVLRFRECILEGSQLYWTDRVFYDGKLYLSLDDTDTWTAHEWQALALKVLWSQEVQHTMTERIRLQEGCIKLMRQLRLSEGQSGTSLSQLLIPVLALLAFIGQIIISILLSKQQGWKHPGGVMGSIIHYPKDMTEIAPEVNGGGYRTL